MKILFTIAHQTDYATGKKEAIPSIDASSADLKDYITNLLSEVTSRSEKRNFRFPDPTCPTASAIKQFLDSNYLIASSMFVDRLLEIEELTAEKIGHLTEIQKGVLFQAVVEFDGVRKIIVAKAEHSEFLEEGSFYKKKGLPVKRKIFKALLVERATPENKILVYDTQSPMAKYWWENYLELTETYSDVQNTVSAFKSIVGVLDRFRVKYPADHTIIWNSIVRYFRAEPVFRIEDLADKVIGEAYRPQDPKFPYKGVIEKLKKLPEEKGFDAHFGIVPEKVDGKLKKLIIPLSNKMDLVLKEDIADNEIFAFQEDGIKYVKIRSAEGYERFKRKN